MVARAQSLHFGGQAVEVGRAVNQRLNPIPLAPCRNLRRGIPAFRIREKPIGPIRHSEGLPN